MSINSQEIKKQPENHKNHEQKFTGAKEKIDERRHRIHLLDLQGHSNQEIADSLGVSLSCIEKDLHYMKYYCLKWSKDLVDAGRKKSFFDSSSQIEIAQKELWQMYKNEKDVLVKKKILDSIVSYSTKKEILFKNKPHFSLYDNFEVPKLAYN